MNHEPNKLRPTQADVTDSVEGPVVVERDTFQAELDALRVREKAHTREGDAIAAARHRLPMVEMDPSLPAIWTGNDNTASICLAVVERPTAARATT
jgi:hypothetical protein